MHEQSTARTTARHHLRRRAVLFEATRRTLYVPRKGRKHQPISLTPDQAARWPILAAYLAAHQGWPPPITRDHRPRLRHLNAMQEKHGPLVLLTVALDALDALPLFSPEVGTLSRDAVREALDEISRKARPSVAAGTQRGEWLGTHTHFTMPAAHLAARPRLALDRAPSGPGGGTFLLPDLHGVQMHTTPADLARVARYLTRHPDARLDTPGTDAYLDALDEEAQRLADRRPAVRLVWSWDVK